VVTCNTTVLLQKKNSDMQNVFLFFYTETKQKDSAVCTNIKL